MLSPHNIPVRTKSVKTKSKSRQTVKYRLAGSGTKPATLAISGLPGPKHNRQPRGMTVAHMVEHQNPCIRRMRELHTVEIRNKRTKELVDLEVSPFFLSVYCYYLNSCEFIVIILIP